MSLRSFLSVCYLLISIPSLAQINFKDQAINLGLTQNTGQSIFGGHGVSYIDFDGDGFDDITLGSGLNTPVLFYKNIDGVIFTSISMLPNDGYTLERIRSVSWVDFDNDGDKDLFLTSDTDGNRLYRMDNALVDITQQAGFPLDNLTTYGASWGDIDNDGCLDVYLSNRIGGTTITNYLFKNNCDGTFSEVTDTVGLSNSPALTFCSAFFDFNNDGWQDLYVANDKFQPNYLYKNNGDGTFTDVSTLSGTGVVMDAMSVTIDDFNNDGYFDIYITNTPIGLTSPFPDNLLLLNNGDESFTNVTASSGTGVDSFCWGSNFLDADNDMDLDLYVNSQYEGNNGYPSYAFFLNSADGTFTQPNDVGFLSNNYKSYASAIGDYNNDGLMEIAVNNDDNQIPSLWENTAENSNNFIAVRLEGNQSNKDGIGSVIEIAVNGEEQYRYTLTGEGYLSQNSSTEIFGLGTQTIADYVKVKWLSGIEDVYFNVPANQILSIAEGQTLSLNTRTKSQFSYFPNPTLDVLTVNAISENIDEIALFNLLGQQVKTLKPKALSSNVDMANLESGTYFLRVSIGNVYDTVRVVKL